MYGCMLNICKSGMQIVLKYLIIDLLIVMHLTATENDDIVIFEVLINCLKTCCIFGVNERIKLAI